MAKMGIRMDGVTYRVAITFPSLTRAFSFIEGVNKGVSLNGRTILDTIGTAYSYTMNVEALDVAPRYKYIPRGSTELLTSDGKLLYTAPDYDNDYDDFFWAISDPQKRQHTITMPFGQSTITFGAYVTGGSDIFQNTKSTGRKWGGMTVNFIPIAPQRT